MSLVNDMLNDLDDRRSQKAREEVNLDWMTGQKQTSKNKWLMPLMSFVVIAIFVAIAVAVFRYQNTANQEAMDKLAAIAPKQQLQPVSELAVKLAENPVVKKAAPVQQVVPVAEALAEAKTPIDNIETVKPAPEKKTPVTKVAQPVKTPKPLTLAQRDLIASQQAKKLLRNNQPLKAEEKLIAFMRGNPLAIRSGKVLATIWLSQKNYRQAEQLLIPLGDVAPRDIELIIIQARLYFSLKQLDQSMNLLLSERPAASKHTDYYELLGYVARSNQQYDYSVQSYRTLLEYDASRGDWWVGMAIALDLQGKNKLAKEAYRRGIESGRISQSLSDYARKRIPSL